MKFIPLLALVLLAGCALHRRPAAAHRRLEPNKVFPPFYQPYTLPRTAANPHQ